MNQTFTIAKIGGRSADRVLSMFQRWYNARLTDDPDEWSHEQWPEIIRSELTAWAQRLCAHGHRPPICFFVEYVDMWSMFDLISRNICEPDLIYVLADTCEAWCLPLNDPKKLSQQLRDSLGDVQFDEDRWFVTVVAEAIDAWRLLIDTSVLVILRTVHDVSCSDEAMKLSFEQIPVWLK